MQFHNQIKTWGGSCSSACHTLQEQLSQCRTSGFSWSQIQRFATAGFGRDTGGKGRKVELPLNAVCRWLLGIMPLPADNAGTTCPLLANKSLTLLVSANPLALWLHIAFAPLEATTYPSGGFSVLDDMWEFDLPYNYVPFQSYHCIDSLSAAV